MSAFDKLIEAPKNTEIELCILWVADDAERWEDGEPPYDHAKAAAEELAALKAELDKFKTLIADTSDCLIRNNLEGTAHKRATAAALKERREK